MGASSRTCPSFFPLDAWSADCLERARAAGGDVPALTLARCHWRLGDLRGAAEEFRRAAQRREAPEAYLQDCLAAMEREARAATRPTTRPTTAP